jgi:hypothetical protein
LTQYAAERRLERVRTSICSVGPGISGAIRAPDVAKCIHDALRSREYVLGSTLDTLGSREDAVGSTEDALE